jgi:hypothetical protein
MTRPVRPVALVILTACMVYPGVTMLFQGLYPFVAGDLFSQMNDPGLWFNLAQRMGISPIVPSLLKAGLGTAWVAGVLGLWAGDGKAYPLVVLAALGTLLYPSGAMVMAVLALVCLFFFRENAEEVPA